MSLREAGWTTFLVGLPFAHLLFRPHLDIWHGQAAWAQGGVLMLWAMSVGTPSAPFRPNRPLAWFLAWMSFMALWVWVKTIIAQRAYPLPMLQGLVHLLLLYLFYQSAVTTWTVATLSRLLRSMAWAGVVVLVYCGLQLLELDQFFKQLDSSFQGDALVGTIGNPSHLASYLSMLLALFLLQPGWFWKWMAGCAVVLLLLTGSFAGQVCGGIVLAWWGYHWKPWTCWISLPCFALGMLWVGLHPHWLNPHGRWLAWQEFYTVFKQQPITGYGAGFVMEFSRTVTDPTSPIFHWRHVHNEWFQAAIEYGVVGLGMWLWMVKELVQQVWTLPKTPLVVVLTGVLLAFGVNSLVTFPAHLWLTGSIALVAYCGLQVCVREQRV